MRKRNIGRATSEELTCGGHQTEKAGERPAYGCSFSLAIISVMRALMQGGRCLLAVYSSTNVTMIPLRYVGTLYKRILTYQVCIC